MITAEERDALISAATTAHRERDLDGQIVVNSAWMDLDAEGRREAYEQTLVLRMLERAASPDGSTSTVRAVLDRITRA